MERFNRTLVAMMRKFVNEDCDNWDKFLPYLIYAYNTTPSKVTGETPFRLMFGRDPKPMLDLPIEGEPTRFATVDEYRVQLDKRMREAFRVAQRASLEEYHRMKDRFARQARLMHYREGDLVWLKRMAFSNLLHKKLSRKYTGPWRITKVKGPNVEVQALGTEAVRLVHRDHIKPCYVYTEPPVRSYDRVLDSEFSLIPDPEILEATPQAAKETPEEIQLEEEPINVDQDFFQPGWFLKQKPPVKLKSKGQEEHFFTTLEEAMEYARYHKPKDFHSDPGVTPEKSEKGTPADGGSPAVPVVQSDEPDSEELGLPQIIEAAQELCGGTTPELSMDEANVLINQMLLEQAISHPWAEQSPGGSGDKEHEDESFDAIWERIRHGTTRSSDVLRRREGLRKEVKPPCRWQ